MDNLWIRDILDGAHWPPEKRLGPPPYGVLEDPEKRRQTGRAIPDVWQDDVSDDSMPPPRQREEASHLLHMDP